jgi:HlyD family secretion protein
MNVERPKGDGPKSQVVGRSLFASRAAQLFSTEKEVSLPLAVLEFQSPTSAVIAMPVPPVARMTSIWITLLVLSLLVVASVMKVDKIVSAPGKLVSTASTIVVQPFVTSIVQSINVQEGQIVHKGDVLATLNPTYATADLTALTAQQQAYSAEVARLQAQESGLAYNPDPANPASALQISTYNQQIGEYNATVQDYNEKIQEAQTNIAGYNEQAAYYRQRLAVAENVEDMRERLQSLNVGSKIDTLAATDDRLNIQGNLANAESSSVAAQRDLASQQSGLAGYQQQWKGKVSQQLSDAINSLTQAEQALEKAKLNDQLLALTAPRDSIVLSVAQTSVGAVLQSGQTLMELVPVDAQLRVEADVSGEDSGYVHPGDKVKIKFDTLPFIQYGTADGVVLSVSPDSFNPADPYNQQMAGAALPAAPRSLYYKTEISLGALHLHNTPPGFRLVPGMPLSADVLVGTRTIMGYFTRRILPVAYDSLHEP